MLHIALYLPQLGLSEGRCALRIAHALEQRGARVTVIGERPDGALSAAFERTFAVRSLPSRVTPLAPAMLAQTVRELAPDCVVAIGGRAVLNAGLAARLGLIRPALYAWERGVIVQPMSTAAMFNKLEARVLKAVAGAFDAWMFSSPGAAREAAAALALKSSPLIVGEPGPTTPPPPAGPIEIKFINRLRAPRIASLAPMTEAGDQITLLRAYQQASRVIGGSLLLVGDGPRRAELEAAAIGLGVGDRVIFAGDHEHPGALLSACDLFVTSARMDGAGDGLIEALSQGLPIVATDCPTAPREILADGKFGVLTPVGDVPALARAIQFALQADHDPPSLKRRAEDFTARRCVETLLKSAPPPPGQHAPAADMKAA